MNAESVFEELGFNALEAEVYVALLRNGAQTAYRIGKLLGKPTANVYKAVDVLLSKGAIEIEESDVRLCKALPIASIASQLERDYKNKISKATSVLEQLTANTREEGIYKLQSVEAVVQRAMEMLARCKVVVVADLFPAALEMLRPSLESCVAAKKEVLLQAYTDVVIKGASVAVPTVAPDVLKYWNAQQMNIVVDGSEMLVALFNHDMSELVQATYSNNLYLSCMMHAGLISEHKVHLFSRATSMKEINAIKDGQKFFLNSSVPGLDILFEQYKK